MRETPSLTTFLLCSFALSEAVEVGSETIETSWSISAKSSMVSVGANARLNLAILCKTSIASASLPRPRRYLGLSWNVKSKVRAAKTSRATPPRMTGAGGLSAFPKRR